MLPDVLKKDLRVVFCGTAAGRKSAQVQMYYAGKGNKFWKVLREVDLTPELLSPRLYTNLLKYRIGLTDLAKQTSGMDYQVDFEDNCVEVLRGKVLKYKPTILCFNGKRAAIEFLMRSVNYGIQEERIGSTRLFVAPSTSGAANRYWDISRWQELEQLTRLQT